MRAALIALLLAIAAAGCQPEEMATPDTLAESCITAACHGGVENIHYGGPRLTCVDCHGGNPKDPTKKGAHVTVDWSFNPSTPGANFLSNPTLADLDAMPPEALRFINPADYRVARMSCGKEILHGVGCHATITDNSLLLNRATLAGTYAGGGFIAGIQDKKPHYAVVPTADRYLPKELPDGVLKELVGLPDAAPAHVTDPVAKAFFPVFEQLCVECHLNQDGPHVPGRYYSSGCNGCHMITADDGRTVTGDITQDVDEGGHVREHRLTNEIPDSQCARCHISHLGRSLLAQGVRERSEPEGDGLFGGPNRGVEDPEHHVPWDKKNYVKYKGMLWNFGKPYPFFIEDEDGTNEVDETPPDIHTEKGMACIDCHNIRESHGDRNMEARMDFELDVRCETCHGRPGEKGSLESDAGFVFTKSGTTVGDLGDNNLVFSTAMNGEIKQLGKLDKTKHPVTQITERTSPSDGKYNLRTRMGCELHAGTAGRRKALKQAVNALAAKDPAAVAEQYPGLPAGFTFTEMPDEETNGRTECFTCHNAWTVNCYGCHIVRDDRESYVSRVSGKKKQGAVRTFGMSVLSDALALGYNIKGRITPLVGTSIFFTHIDGQGNKAIDASPLTTAEGMTGEGNVHNPVHHHTTRRQPRDCDGCHPSANGTHDDKALLRATGLGTGEHTFIDGKGVVHWLDRLVRADYDGDGKLDDPKAKGRPSKVATVQAVVGTTHMRRTPQKGQLGPGPLDVTAINRMLGNVVVPQREKTGGK